MARKNSKKGSMGLNSLQWWCWRARWRLVAPAALTPLAPLLPSFLCRDRRDRRDCAKRNGAALLVERSAAGSGHWDSSCRSTREARGRGYEVEGEGKGRHGREKLEDEWRD
jgi:hypothetical protein